MFEQVFKNIDDDLRKEAGCTTELDYTEQTSWLLFLKYLDALEQDKAVEAELHKKKYTFIDLGRPEEIGRIFSGFQRYLYQRVA
jgi:type I restriction enzyme M protein